MSIKITTPSNGPAAMHHIARLAATALVSGNGMAVEYDASIDDDGINITIRRTVRNMPQAGPRKVLHQETIAVLATTGEAIALARDLAWLLAKAKSSEIQP